ncbi:MAG: hypothetical protein OEW83_21540 [Acidimicrobiia bacterium]|nr:hypothetical protein [Acidimicrobiia bacterium]
MATVRSAGRGPVTAEGSGATAAGSLAEQAHEQAPAAMAKITRRPTRDTIGRMPIAERPGVDRCPLTF